jgi:hypothetical protein
MQQKSAEGGPCATSLHDVKAKRHARRTYMRLSGMQSSLENWLEQFLAR